MPVNPTIQLPYRRGPATATGAIWITATKFTFQSRTAAVLATPRALRFWATWQQVQGSIGLSVRFQPRPLLAWTLTAWNSPSDLKRFLASPHHREAVAAFANRLDGTSDTWRADAFNIPAGWQHATAALSGR